jgi:exodeoxyribonuclease VII large subunit
MQRRFRTPVQRLAHLTERLRRKDIAIHIATTHRRLQNVDQCLQHALTQTISARQTRLNRASTRLEMLSPLGVLSRGYALIYAVDGSLLRSAADVNQGEAIRASLAHGTLEATVTQTSIDESDVTETKKL